MITGGTEHAAVLRAVNQAALVSDDFARVVAQFGAEQRRDIADHLDGLVTKGIQLPSTPEASLAMIFLSAQALFAAVEDGTVELTHDEAVEGLTRFVYRGLTGRDYAPPARTGSGE